MADDPGGTHFMVDLAALGDAIGSISGERTRISGGITTLRGTFTKVENHWQSPAGDSFVTLVTNFNTVTDTMLGLLDEAIGKMQTAHDNYAATEETNTGNLQRKTFTPGDPDTDPRQGPDNPPHQALTAPNALSPRQEPVAAPALVRPTARQG